VGPKRGRSFHLTFPLRSFVQRFAFALLVAAAIGVMVLGQAEPRFTEGLRSVVTDITVPVLAFFSHPTTTVANVVDEVKVLGTLRAKNAFLEEQNQRLLKWQTLARRLETENAELRTLLKAVPDPHASYVTARVIGEAGGPFVRTALINAGAAKKIAKGQAVLSGDGLIGRIVEVGEASARILLITDLNSRVPIVIEESRDRAVLAGDNSSRASLAFLADNARLNVGDRIITSGEGGIFPPGLPVGTIIEIKDDQVIVQPYANMDRLDFVNVLNFTLPGVLPSTQRAGRMGSFR
jgi:rod shape-determining protein MreC